MSISALSLAQFTKHAGFSRALRRPGLFSVEGRVLTKNSRVSAAASAQEESLY
jgi:hypothetical protein